jgi:hypothetical protein
MIFDRPLFLPLMIWISVIPVFFPTPFTAGSPAVYLFPRCYRYMAMRDNCNNFLMTFFIKIFRSKEKSDMTYRRKSWEDGEKKFQKGKLNKFLIEKIQTFFNRIIC